MYSIMVTEILDDIKRVDNMNIRRQLILQILKAQGSLIPERLDQITDLVKKLETEVNNKKSQLYI